MVLKASFSQVDSKTYSKRMGTRVTEWLVILLFIAFHLYGIGVVQVGELSLAIWDIVIVFFAFLILFRFYIRNIPIKISNIFGISKMIFILSIILTIWITFRALFSPLPERALTMVLIQMLNTCVLIMIITSEDLNLYKINMHLLWVGAGLAVIAIGLYISGLSQYERIIANSNLQHPSVGYYLDSGGVLRLIGLAKDPNFYSLWMTPLLITGLIRGRFSTVLWLPIALSVGMALSRSFFIAILFTSLALTPMLWSARALRKYIIRIITVPLLMISVILCVSVLWTDTEYISKRIELAEKTIRFERWHILNHAIVEDWNPIWGSGLRSTELLLGGKYSHSTYLDALFETGLTGFSLWLAILILVSLLCLNCIKSANSELLPWIYTWFVLLIMFFSFSLLYHPFTWMVIGILVNGIRTPSTSKLHTFVGMHASLTSRGQGI
ncbi:hypothetical protein HRbin15_00721 [bacterium HR15]|nr:hypothetical protein HRbin15_00721 [bacterium HR15]